VIAVIARWRFGGWTEGFGPMLLLPAILLAGLIGGIRVGLAVAVVGLFVAWVGFFPPYGTFMLNAENAVTVGAFIVTAGLQLYVIRALKLAIDSYSASEERSQVLFRELQHRVANNLQVASGMLHKERKGLEPNSPADRALRSVQERLDLMMNVHRSLYSPGIVNLPIGVYLETLARDLIRSSNRPELTLDVAADNVQLDLDRLMSLSMIAAEAITNAVKYAFQDRDTGKIAISFGIRAGSYLLTVSDDGPGFPKAACSSKAQSLGRGIIESLAAQLRGTVSFESGPGAMVRVDFPR
jgi:two-component sensor histidine kinase